MKRLAIVMVLLGVVSGAWGNLLDNAGFEIEDDPGYAASWWYYDEAGRATWAARSGNAGNAFYPAGNTHGGFGQNLFVDMNDGSVFTFTIYAKAEANYTNENTTVGFEFWNGTNALRYAVTNNVYAALDAQRGNWVSLVWIHTARVTDIDRVVVRCDYADGLIHSGASSATCQWDDGALTQTFGPAGDETLELFEPARGMYLGVLLEQGGTAEEIAAFNTKAGKQHAVFAKFVVLKSDPFPWEWVNDVRTNGSGAGLHLVLEPMTEGTFADFYAPDWGPGQDTYDAALDFVTNCVATEMPVFLRFAHEANGYWYPWHPYYSETTNGGGGQPDTVTAETYIEGWQNFADLVHSNAPNVAMVWAPNQGNGPFLLPDYGRTYPGDDYVDWVGLSVYNGSWYGNSNAILNRQFGNAIERGYWQDNDDPNDDTFENFYWEFSDPDNPFGHHKPMMIAETGAQFSPEFAVSNEVTIAQFESLSGPQFTASNTLAQFQDLNSDGWVVTNHSWVEGFEVLGTWNGGPWGMNWDGTSDAVEGTNAVVMSGTPEPGEVYIGGNQRNIDSVPFTTDRIIAEFQDMDCSGVTSVNRQAVENFESFTDWWGEWGVTWADDADAIQGTNAAAMSGTPAGGTTYIGGKGRAQNTFTNWAAWDGIELYVKRTDDNTVDPTLSVTLRSRNKDYDMYTGVTYITPTSTSWVPVRVDFDDLVVTNAFYPAEITALIFSLSSSQAGVTPAGVALDALTVADFTNTPSVDQQWGAPWMDGSDLSGGSMTWEQVSDGLAGYGTYSLHMGGVDANTNSYVGGNGFSTRSDNRDWSTGSHVAFLMRRAANTNLGDSSLRLELVDGAARTASVSRAASITNYAWYVAARTDFVVDTGFAWSNVQQVKFHLLAGTPGTNAADLYIKQFELGSVSNQTPSDWSAWDGMELWVHCGTETNVYPMLSLTVRSEDANTNYSAVIQKVVTGTNYYPLHIAFEEMDVEGGFLWTNISTLTMELLSEQTGAAPASLYVDKWTLVEMSNAPYADQDWWPQGALDLPGGDDTDLNGGWHTWTVVADPLNGYPTNSAKLSGWDANSNSYIGGNGFSPQGADADWSDVEWISLLARCGGANTAEALLSISLRDGSGVRTAQVSQVIVATNYTQHLLALNEMTVDTGFNWTNISAVVIEMLSGTPGAAPTDVYLKELSVGTASNEYDQDWWPQGPLNEPGGDVTWTLNPDATQGVWSLQISGIVTNTVDQWYIGGNGCSMPVPQQDWSGNNALVLWARKGGGSGVPPRVKIVLDNDYAATNGNEATYEARLDNADWREVIFRFEDFSEEAGFAWTNIRALKLEMFTSQGGKAANDIYLDDLRRASVTITNNEDNIRWKRDWIDQLYSLSNRVVGSTQMPPPEPDYVSVLEAFRNVHMINWFHIRKFEDGMTKDLGIAEESIGPIAYVSYHNRIQDSYFLTNIVTDWNTNGLGDDWEAAYFPGESNILATADADGDGMNNWQEYVAGTEPDNISDVLSVVGEGLVTGGSNATVVLHWDSTEYAVYSVQQTTNLQDRFRPVADKIPATPPVNTCTVRVDQVDRQFLRIQLNP